LPSLQELGRKRALTKCYEIRRIKIVLDGRRVGNGDIAVYFENKAYFTKRGLNKRNVLHELDHHLAYGKKWEMSERIEETEASRYARRVLRKIKGTS